MLSAFPELSFLWTLPWVTILECFIFYKQATAIDAGCVAAPSLFLAFALFQITWLRESIIKSHEGVFISDEGSCEAPVSEAI